MDILIAAQNFQPEFVTVYDASTPEKRAKAFTHEIMRSYGAASVNTRDEFPDIPEMHALLVYLDQIVVAKEEAWKLPAPDDHPFAKQYKPAAFSCLAEFLTQWIAYELWPKVLHMPTTGNANSCTISELKTAPAWNAREYSMKN